MTIRDSTSSEEQGREPTVGPPSLRRPLHGRMVAGVAAGIARYLDIDPVLVRIVVVVLAVFGPGLVLYAAGWLLIPDETTEISVGEHWLDHLVGLRP